jgi:hypothetical protein
MVTIAMVRESVVGSPVAEELRSQDHLRRGRQKVVGMEEPVKAFATSFWTWGIGGLFALTVGLLFVIRPRKSGEIWWKITQATRPWRVRKVPLGVNIAVGCLGLLIAAAFFYAAWITLQR